MMRHLRSVAACAVALVLVLSGCQDSTTVLEPASVQQNRTPLASCDVVVPDDHATISAGVDAASAGSTVCVTSGTYQEQVVINKDLVLSGINDPVIQAPADPADYTIPESSATWEPIVFAFGGSATAMGNVSGTASITVTVQGFVVDGNDRQPNTRRSVGIFYRNVEGDVTENTVENMSVGGKETFGILAYGDSDVKIRDNVVSDYERGGIGANGDGGAHPAPKVEISGNHVSTAIELGEAWAPNGIQIGFGATGNIRNNVVRDNRWSGSGWVASCIIVFETDGVNVKDNDVENCDAAITVGSWAWINPPSADNTKIQGNTVTEASVGIYLQAIAWDGVSTDDPSVSNSKIDRNELMGGSLGSVGIALLAHDGDPDYDPIVENNKVIRNSISGFDTDLAEFGETDDTKQQANVFE